MKTLIATIILLFLAGCVGPEAYDLRGESSVRFVTGTSMQPTLNEASILWIEPIAYVDVQHTMIVVWESWFGIPAVKRVDASRGVRITSDNHPGSVYGQLHPGNLLGYVRVYFTDGELWRWTDDKGYQPQLTNAIL